MSAQVPSLMPARGENTHGGNWDSWLAADLRGDLALQSGRFRIQGRAPSRVRYRARP